MALSDQERRQAAKVRELVEAAGGLEACAAETGISTSQLARYSSKTEKDSMPVRVIEVLEAVSIDQPDHPIMTRYLARQAGFVLVPLPLVDTIDADWNRHIARLSAEVGSLIAGIAEDLADDHDVSAAEAAKRLVSAHRLSVIVAELEATLRARAEGGQS